MQKIERAQVLKVLKVKEFSKGFRKQEIVLECGDKYPSPVIFQITGDNIEKFNVQAGAVVYDVCYNLKGREWNPPEGDVKYYNSLEIWKLSHTEQKSQPLPPGVTPTMNGDMAQEFNDSQSSGIDDMPF